MAGRKKANGTNGSKGKPGRKPDFPERIYVRKAPELDGVLLAQRDLPAAPETTRIAVYELSERGELKVKREYIKA